MTDLYYLIIVNCEYRLPLDTDTPVAFATPRSAFIGRFRVAVTNIRETMPLITLARLEGSADLSGKIDPC